jgi:hypothetical protein
MPTTYAQKQAPAQKMGASSAASVLDASSQSEGLQRKADMANKATQREEAPRPNNTGMPDNLKSGIESLSGFSMDDVRVHYNSSKPATVQALAYTQGTDIHVAPGQEKHLPHEAWHVAQQMAGRVSPTTNINGMPVNDNAGLEHEADVMGEKATKQTSSLQLKKAHENIHLQKNVSQLTIGTRLELNQLNVVGEQHDETDGRKKDEIDYATFLFGPGHYWNEYQFRLDSEEYGESPKYRVIYAFYCLKETMFSLFEKVLNQEQITDYTMELAKRLIKRFYSDIIVGAPYAKERRDIENEVLTEIQFEKIIEFAKCAFENAKRIFKSLPQIPFGFQRFKNDFTTYTDSIEKLFDLRTHQTSDSISKKRSIKMHRAANTAMEQGKYGIWKIGDDHVNDIITGVLSIFRPIKYNLIKKDFFDKYFNPLNTWTLDDEKRKRLQ